MRDAGPLEASRERLQPYIPRIILRQLAQGVDVPVEALHGTVVFVDISGFTALSERLARRGREGAEMLAEAIGSCFSPLLFVAYANGGSLLKFGGDALLLIFEGEGHAERACRSAVQMRRTLREVGRIEVSGARTSLRMSVGVHSGEFHLFLAGESHRELLVSGPAATTVVAMEKAADAGEIVVSPQLAVRLPERCLGEPKGPGRLLKREPLGEDTGSWREEPEWLADVTRIASCLSTAVREQVLAGPQPPEHRTVTVAFIRYQGVDDLIVRRGPDAAAEALDEFVREVQRAVDEQEVCFLGSDVDADGGKLILTAGAPRVVGDDESRMLLALRRIVEGSPPVPIHIGVNRGPVFAGDIGPAYRKSYTVMGDAVNLAARLMAKAPEGEIYASGGVLARAATSFRTVGLEPFRVKGKAQPVRAVVVGPAVARSTSPDLTERFPLVGREHELDVLDHALTSARAHRGRLVEIAGEAGIGKTRLVEEVRNRADDLPQLQAVCEAYTASAPYATWRVLLRQLIGAVADDPDEPVLERLLHHVRQLDPGLTPWLSLLAIPLGVEVPASPEVAALAPEFRQRRLHEVVLRLLRARLAAPVLIEIEDTHHMDAASSALLAAVAAQLQELPWLIVTTRREGDAGFQAPALPCADRIEPGTLSLEDTLVLAETVTEAAPLPPHVLHLAAERSAGNPQFLRDLLRAAHAPGADGELPESIEAAANARIDRLRARDRALVRRAAVLGRSFHPRYLSDVTEDGSSPDEATWQRLDKYFERDGDGHVRFRRALVRDVAYAGLSFRLRRELHAAAGARLERELGDDAAGATPMLSLHFLLAGDHPRAWHHARLAADRARQQFAQADAAQLYERALQAARGLDVAPAELARVWRALGDARAASGELQAAAQAYTAARRLLRDDPVELGVLLARHAELEMRAGRAGRAVRWVRRGLRLVENAEHGPAAALRARLISTLAVARQRQGQMTQAIEVCREAIAAAEAAGEDAALAHACYVLDWALVESGRADEAVHSERALEIYHRLGDLDRESAVLNNLGGFAYRDGRWEEAISLYRRGAEASERAGDAANAAFGDCNVGEVLADQGRYEEAEPRLRRAIRVWRGTDYEWGVAYATSRLGRLAVRTGRSDEGCALIDEARGRFDALGLQGDVDFADALLAEAAVFSGRPERALEITDRLLAVGGEKVWSAPLLRRVRGRALMALGDAAGAEEALRASLAQARREADPYETALTIDAMDELLGADEPLRRERDELLSALGIVSVPRPDVAARPAAAPARRGDGPEAPRMA